MRTLRGCPATVDDQGSTGHETGRLRSQEDDRSPEFLWSTPPAQGDVIEKELVGLWVIHDGSV